MKYNQLQTSSQKSARRVGRGIAAGRGKTAGRGTKGQMARTGSKRRPGFEGGQNPLMQRLPKLHGFRTLRTPSEIIYTDQLEQFANTTVTNETLAAAHLVAHAHSSVKVLKRGELTKKVTVKLQGASTGAVAAIIKVGGVFETSERMGRPAKKTDRAETKQAPARKSATAKKENR